MSPEYFWLRTETALVKVLGKMPSSAMMCIRWRASPFARWVMLWTQLGPAVMVAEEWYASGVIESSSLKRKGTTCGFT